MKGGAHRAGFDESISGPRSSPLWSPPCSLSSAPTGQRRSDVVRLTAQDIVGGLLCLRQQKTSTPLRIPLHPRLRQSLRGVRRGPLIHLPDGRPFGSSGSFANWFKRSCVGRPRPLLRARAQKGRGCPARRSRLQREGDRGDPGLANAERGEPLHGRGGPAQARPTARCSASKLAHACCNAKRDFDGGHLFAHARSDELLAGRLILLRKTQDVGRGTHTAPGGHGFTAAR